MFCLHFAAIWRRFITLRSDARSLAASVSVCILSLHSHDAFRDTTQAGVCSLLWPGIFTADVEWAAVFWLCIGVCYTQNYTQLNWNSFSFKIGWVQLRTKRCLDRFSCYACFFTSLFPCFCVLFLSFFFPFFRPLYLPVYFLAVSLLLPVCLYILTVDKSIICLKCLSASDSSIACFCQYIHSLFCLHFSLICDLQW